MVPNTIPTAYHSGFPVYFSAKIPPIHVRNKNPIKYPPVGPTSLPTPPVNPENTGTPTHPISK